jgi:hypothetical protein
MTIVTTGFGLTLGSSRVAGHVQHARAGARGHEPCVRHLVRVCRVEPRRVPVLASRSARS